MGNEASSLHGEDEAVRNRIPPFLEAARSLEGIESTVDLYGGEYAGGISEFIRLPQFLGGEFPALGCIAPT